MSTGDGGEAFCIVCGERLQREQRYCPACGAPRWRPMLPGSAPPPPAVEPDVAPTPVPGLAWVYAVGAVMWLLLLAVNAAEVAAGPSRAQMVEEIRQAGYSGDLQTPLLAIYLGATVLVPLIVAAVHGAAFYGLRAGRRWGWLAAVVVAGAWSLVLIGVPLLATLLRPSVRRAYGVG